MVELVKNLKIGNYDVLQKIAAKFGVANANIDFTPYLERLKELRNRAAHRERIFNRSYRSISRVRHYHQISQGLSNHKFIDVYMFLFSMLGKLDQFSNAIEFEEGEIVRLFDEFKKDHLVQQDSKALTRKMDNDEFEKVKGFILNKMR